MKFLKEFSLFENSKFPKDKQTIAEICEEYNIKNYTISKDGTVNVDGHVRIEQESITELPLKFGKVSGFFNCSDNKLTTLKGAPREIGLGFDCRHNYLDSLIGGPKHVGGGYHCGHNNLTTLEGLAQSIGDLFVCEHNNLTSLEGCPERIKGNFVCSSNNLKSLVGGPNIVDGSYWCGSNKLKNLIGAPKVSILFDCSDNQLESLKEAPKTVLLYMDFSDNPIYTFDLKPGEFNWADIIPTNCISEIVGVFGSAKIFFESLKYNYFLGGNLISESRFVQACDDLGTSAPEKLENYEWK
ncbi:hypothetical protein EBU71_15200 [bacterium]|nr:hypothetical protein [Candidatus Elulimicrobium humile]